MSYWASLVGGKFFMNVKRLYILYFYLFFSISSVYSENIEMSIHYEVLTKKEMLLKLWEMVESSEIKLYFLENNQLENTPEYYQELGYYQGLTSAIRVAKLIKTN